MRKLPVVMETVRVHLMIVLRVPYGAFSPYPPLPRCCLKLLVVQDLSNLVRILGGIWGPSRPGVPLTDCLDQNREIP